MSKPLILLRFLLDMILPEIVSLNMGLHVRLLEEMFIMVSVCNGPTCQSKCVTLVWAGSDQ